MKKFTFGFLAGIVVMLLVGFSSDDSLKSISDSLKRIAHSMEVIANQPRRGG